MWSDNKVRELIMLKVLHTSLLNITVVTLEVFPLGSYAPMSALRPPFKTILELVLWNALQSILMSSVSSKCLISILPLSSGTEKSNWVLGPVNREGVAAQLLIY
jgi:hypothetical protein